MGWAETNSYLREKKKQKGRNNMFMLKLTGRVSAFMWKNKDAILTCKHLVDLGKENWAGISRFVRPKFNLLIKKRVIKRNRI